MIVVINNYFFLTKKKVQKEYIKKMIVVGNSATQETSQKSQFKIFQVLKNIKKGYIEMTEKIYLENFEKCPGSLYFPLLR